MTLTNYYEDEDNVSKYIQFTPAHDGALLVDTLSAQLAPGAAVLEIGIGPGKDFKLLKKRFAVTGSDLSRVFLDRYRQLDETADLLHLDARTLDTDRTFDAIFSNKALIHLSAQELQQSFNRQHALLNDGGIILHSFWYGDKTQEFHGLTLVQHNEAALQALLEEKFDILALEQHAKMAEGDSIYVLARKK